MQAALRRGRCHDAAPPAWGAPAFAACLILLAAAAPALAQSLDIGRSGEPGKPQDLAALPTKDVSVTFIAGGGSEHGDFSGPLLWDAIGAAGLVAPGAAKGRLAHTVLITGRDGYAVSVAFGEIEPAMEGKSVILATRQDAKPIGHDEIRLVVPGDKHGARNVRDVVRVEVR